MVFAVAVDVPPMEAAAAARTLATCNAALGPEQCVLSGASPGSDGASRWFAVVRYGPDGEAKLTIELYENNRDGNRVASSELEFKERDSPEERWASAGVVVAALVLAQAADQNRVEKKPEPAPVLVAKPPVSSPPAPVQSPSSWLRLDLGATAGSEVRSKPLRVGPLLRVGVPFPNLPIFALASGAYTVRSSGGTDMTWVTGSLGAGVRVGFARQRGALELRAEAVLETLGIQASDGVRSESARRTRVGSRFGFDLSGYLAKNWAVVMGGEAGVLGPRVVIDVAGQTEELPPFVWGVLFALRYDFR
jgi:hypothetical protein